jgi:L-asparagine transporter-like permease
MDHSQFRYAIVAVVIIVVLIAVGAFLLIKPKRYPQQLTSVMSQ